MSRERQHVTRCRVATTNESIDNKEAILNESNYQRAFLLRHSLFALFSRPVSLFVFSLRTPITIAPIEAHLMWSYRSWPMIPPTIKSLSRSNWSVTKRKMLTDVKQHVNATRKENGHVPFWGTCARQISYRVSFSQWARLCAHFAFEMHNPAAGLHFHTTKSTSE